MLEQVSAIVPTTQYDVLWIVHVVLINERRARSRFNRMKRKAVLDLSNCPTIMVVWKPFDVYFDDFKGKAVMTYVEKTLNDRYNIRWSGRYLDDGW